MIGVQVVMALLLKKAPKVFNEPASRMNKSAIPFTMKTIGEPPITKGSFFYKSKVTLSKHQFLGRDAGGGTNHWG